MDLKAEAKGILISSKILNITIGSVTLMCFGLQDEILHSIFLFLTLPTVLVIHTSKPTMFLSNDILL